MNAIVRKVSSTLFGQPGVALSSPSWELQQWRGIRVKVRNGNLEQALVFMQRKMQSSGIERLIKREQTHHLKNSEKRVLARKNLERKIRSQDLARKLKSILVKKVRLGLVWFGLVYKGRSLWFCLHGVYESSSESDDFLDLMIGYIQKGHCC
ncbi:hypothetical protein TEA_011172 [Camellia sinensis var. sinensis]|uniref:Ribosomal protein S21 n=1 Tax=Camellia sinensis var. sinensis TaxID=542762 RepID=A0A4S4EWV3_CAMSN|nr:hypothetical protein TEA_011172 [Camellia sinensis var. sinensis]